MAPTMSAGPPMPAQGRSRIPTKKTVRISISLIHDTSSFAALKGRYTLVDKETLSLPTTPRSSFRQSVRKSLRKLKQRNKKKQQQTKSQAKNNDEGSRSESKYELTVTLKEAEEDIYDIVHAEENITDPEHGQEIIIKEYASRKPFFTAADDDNKCAEAFEEEDEDKKTTKVLLHNEEVESLLKNKEMEMNQFPRGPLGDLLKQKSLKNDVTVSNDTNSTNDGDLETAEPEQETADINVEIELLDKEDVNEEEIKYDSDDDEGIKESRKTVLIDEGFVYRYLCLCSFDLPLFLQEAKWRDA